MSMADDFNQFLRDSANLVVAAMSAPTEGNSPTLDALWTAHLVKSKGKPEAAA